jgi:hypothetical protein
MPLAQGTAKARADETAKEGAYSGIVVTVPCYGDDAI